MKIEHNEKTLERVHEWIKAADQKVSIFLAFQGVVITLILSQIELEKLLIVPCPAFSVVLLISGVVLIVFSFFKSLSAIIPRMGKKFPKSLTFFGGIADMTLAEYKKMVEASNDAEYQEELISQAHISSQIAKRKHIMFTQAIQSFIVGFVLLAVFFLILMFYGY